MTAPRSRRPVRPEVPEHGVITGLGVVSGDPDARHVTAGRTRLATLYLRDVESLGLHPGRALDPDLATAVASRHEFRIGYRSALRRLAAKARSTVEIQRGLRRRGHTEEIIEQIVDRLGTVGYLDDAQYARSTGEAIARQQPASARYIESKLRERGIERSEAGRVASEVAGDPRLAARTVAERALRSLRSCDEATRRRRLWGRLARRGFPPDIIAEVLQDLDTPSGE